MTMPSQSVGDLLRDWRQRRRLSQLDLASEAEISTRHLSFLETGRSQPSREMLLKLAEQLGVPLRERNVLLTAAGYAPVFAERRLDDPALEAARKAIRLVLAGHEPYPALAVDRHWHLVDANAGVTRLMAGADQSLLRPPINVLRLSLHPKGLAPRIANLAEWRAHLLARLHRQIELTADPVLSDLLRELSAYPKPPVSRPPRPPRDYHSEIAVPLQLMAGSQTLTLFSTTTIFGTPVDITLSEIAIEAFFPADTETAEALREMAATPR
ncbi:MAG: helix-turn-helix transcriptional regulator [Sphingomonadales bacterium]|nr:helix-turn-helix transcriptional regulator [Sphingomonadales bacterium]